MLSHCRIVLVNTSHPGNIGAAARAMKTMGLSRLYLVAPQRFPHVHANEMASGALDILGHAVVVNELDDAIADCGLIIGTSTRLRTIPWPLLSPRTCAEKIRTQIDSTEIAILFGREQSGLTNEELHRCHYHLHIPSNPEYSSLNLAAAVQIIAYELRIALSDAPIPVINDAPLATHHDLQRFYEHLERVMIATDFLNPTVPRQLMTRLYRLFSRTHLDRMELNILRGLLTSIEKKLNMRV